MIIDSVEYNIKYPLSSKWNMSVTRRALTSNSYRTWDRGVANDHVTASIVVHGKYDELLPLMTYIEANNSDTIDIQFTNGEDPFGSHVNHLPTYTGVIENYNSRRVNNTFWEISFDYTVISPNIQAGVVATLDNLWYPASYNASDEYVNEVSTFNMYGEYASSFTDTKGVHNLTFNLDETRSAELLKYMVTLGRGDGFTLPADWLSIYPFAQKTFTHAILLSLSYVRDSFDNYNVTLGLESYDNS